jgi:4-hydroxy-tetrahydrodipicolinate reductase
MGSAVLNEAKSMDIEITGAIEIDSNPMISKSLRDIGICDSDIILQGSSRIVDALEDSDVFVTFTNPDSELLNVPEVVKQKKSIVMGTTGFSDEQKGAIEGMIGGQVPAVISPNFSIGVNLLFKLTEQLTSFPKGYDISVFEVHHTGKVDSPSGTAKKLGEIISNAKGYDRTVHGREGSSRRTENEMEVLSSRAGGVPGMHDIIVAGPHEMMRIEHSAFSRRTFAQGALHAAKWLVDKREPRIFTMSDVLGI